MNKKNRTTGMSIVEVIIAMAIMVIIASASAATIIGSFSSGRLAMEETQASSLAYQGFQALLSIKNQDWSNLSEGTFGVSSASGKWVLSGSSDNFEKFTRSATLILAHRDSQGNLVGSGGSVDPETYLAQVKVDWNFTLARANSVIVTGLLTNWQLSKSEKITVTPTLSPTPTPTPTQTTYQAESYSGISGCTVMTNHTGYTGTGFVDYGTVGSWTEWNNVQGNGLSAILNFRYSNGSAGDRNTSVSVNGSVVGNLTFPLIGSWDSWSNQSITVTLNSGVNTIRLTATPGDGPNLDQFVVTY